MILEIIELRTIDREEVLSKSSLNELLNQFMHMNEAKNRKKTWKIFSNITISTDVSIHIIHHQDSFECIDRLCGHQIRNLLEKWGLVNHTIWKEEK